MNNEASYPFWSSDPPPHCVGQSEASILVTWLLSTNQRPVSPAVSVDRSKSVLMWPGYEVWHPLSSFYYQTRVHTAASLPSMIDIWIIALQISLISKRDQSGMNWICQIYSDHCLDSPQPLFNSPAHLFRSQTSTLAAFILLNAMLSPMRHLKTSQATASS